VTEAVNQGLGSKSEWVTVQSPE